MRELGPGEVRAAVPVGRPRSPRDPRLDVLRGIALVMIFINHVPGNFYENLTSRSFGFSDAAEGFVLMSGVSAGLAYGLAFKPGGQAWTGLARIWGRVWTLYLVHVLVTALAFAIAAGLALWANIPGLLHLNGIEGIYLHPLQTLFALPLLIDQLGYANILPLYCVLLAVTPALLWAAWRAPRALLVGSVTLWFVAGQMRWNVPTWPIERGWQFSPFSWQILFVIGLFTGLRLKEGRRFVPAKAWLLWLCGAFLLLVLMWRWVPPVSEAMNHGMWLLSEAGAPWVLVNHQKVWETAPRLLHALALAYLLATLPVVRRVCASAVGAPFALLGRHALPVFALGSVLAFLLQGIKTETGEDLLLDSAMLGAGLWLQFALAFAKDRWPAR
ncbi:OpgC family protein [Rubellimicrobium roseum]|uniref:OpgC domain-containing protein n=1 Tax=Rubellimicrobium roseum TaxID=687525 RepID=A0A5C4N9A6_9RHOB|nr:OpgC domain-containing protein [Rubellimicrobium roseum]TNC66824.1 OpgC domain-containing protein [Rubellimicrobium roseum]